jgi:nucleoid DNA-binding protein
MTFTELVENTAANLGKSKKDVADVLENTLMVIKSEILDHHSEVTIKGFGRFKCKHTDARTLTFKGKECKVPARDTMKFTSFSKREV